MKDLKIEYRDGKFVHVVVDGVEMNHITAIQFSHEVGETLPTLSLSGHMMSGPDKSGKEREQVNKVTK
ncbi:hypothetical protein [Pantoea stewartii]|uniref:hypothetical protein n=1 Tax=Pantoea stewartii TaxID=66269 RepID=UPI0025A08EA2|nr:hypothetical protein [Pantoea stewartii]